MFNTEGLDESSCWGLGANTRPNQTLKARGDLLAKIMTDLKLVLVPDNDPDRHVEVIGWPVNDGEELKVRKRLAEKAELKVRPV